MTYDATLRARPTVYRGIQMRSRLEAKWAAAFDRKGRVWEYEPRCFANERGQYLPDFLVSDDRGGMVYVEIKPPLSVNEVIKAAERMEIIWDSEPEATLAILAGQVSWDASRLSGGSVWRGSVWSLLHGVRPVDDGSLIVRTGPEWTAVHD